MQLLAKFKKNSVQWGSELTFNFRNFSFTQIKKFALAIFSKWDTVPACVKTEVGRQFLCVINFSRFSPQ